MNKFASQSHSSSPRIGRFFTVGPVQLTINADDFGYSASVNAGIVASFENGLIHTSTIMSNMPGFDEACDLIHSRQLAGKIGVHFNISEGRPLSSDMKRSRVFCDKNGFYSATFTNGRLFFAKEDMKVLMEELRAQVLVCHSRGIAPTHIDSHNHFHTIWAVAGAVMNVAREFGIQGIRLSRNIGPRPIYIKRLYKRFFNHRLRRNALARSDLFGSVADFVSSDDRVCGVAEVMVHPDLSRNGAIIDRVTNNQLDPEIRRLISRLSSDLPMDENGA